ncbi:phosphotransferase [Kitasatospora sp. NPDC085464]|uniref:phosphotransferase n=1 Tax=Kitasatospora sp. NPDC085464 TaxID=3364063 RepID=UPI0037CC09BB
MPRLLLSGTGQAMQVPDVAQVPDRAAPTALGTVDELVAAGVLSADEVVDTGLAVEVGARRNRNLVITRPDGSGYFVKVPNEQSPMSRSTLRSEIDFYRAAAGRGHPFDALLVRLVHADRQRPLLVLEFRPEHRGLGDIVRERPAGEFPVSLYQETGRLLGELHAAGPDWTAAPTAPPEVAPVTDYGRPDPWLLCTASRGTLMLVEMVQSSPELSSGLTELVSRWRPGTVVHGDVRAANVLVRPRGLHPGAARPDAARGRDIRLVDWELWHLGDPAQDLAGLVESVVRAALGPVLDPALAAPPSRPTGTGPPPTGPGVAAAGLVLQATCRAVWRAYLSVRPSTVTAQRDLAARTAAFTAARLVQTQVEEAGRSEAVSVGGCAMLEIAANIFTDPDRAATEFLALT